MMKEAQAYQALRVGFTAAVSHELRTPLARLLALLDSATLPGADRDELLAQAREQVEQMTELVNDVLFLSELAPPEEPASGSRSSSMWSSRREAGSTHRVGRDGGYRSSAASPSRKALPQLAMDQGERLDRRLEHDLGNRLEEQLRPVCLTLG